MNFVKFVKDQFQKDRSRLAMPGRLCYKKASPPIAAVRQELGMGERSKETLGQYLRLQRQSRNLSLDQLSRTTRIGIPFLRALEEDDYDFFSQREFITGFLKLYARHLDLDVPEVLRRYSFQSEEPRQKKDFRQLPLFGDFNLPLEKVTRKRWLPGRRLKRGIIGAGLLFLASGLFLYLQFTLEKTRVLEPSSPALPPQEAGEKPQAIPAVPVGEESAPLKAPSAPQIDLSARATADQMETPPAINPASPARKKMKIIGNRDSRRYHLPGMKYYDKVLAYHRVEFDSEEEAMQAGYHKARQ